MLKTCTCWLELRHPTSGEMYVLEWTRPNRKQMRLTLYMVRTRQRERLKSRNCFLRSVKPADFFPKVIRCSAWLRRLQAIPHRATVNLDESLTKGFDRSWTTWSCLNRLRTGFTCSKEQRQRWRYYEEDMTCECGLATENTAHMMQYTRLAQPCSLDDLNTFNDTAKKCMERWKTLVWWHDDDNVPVLRRCVWYVCCYVWKKAILQCLQFLRGGIWACMRCPCLCLC